MPDNFGEILKNIRKEEGLTNARLSQMLGISPGCLSRLESGKTKRVNPKLVWKICQTLNISENQLLGIEPEENCISEGNKAKKLEHILKYMKEKLKGSKVEDQIIVDITCEIDRLMLNTSLVDGRINIICDNGLIPMGGFYKEDEMLYELILMSFWGKLYYKCRKVVIKVQKEEHCKTIDSLLLDVGRELRKQAIYNIKPNKKFQTEQFIKEFKKLIETAVNALGHKYDKIGHLTKFYNPQEADELKEIRKIYETIIFKGEEEIEYYDYLTKTSRKLYIYNAVEMQYVVMNLYAKAFAESVLWLKKEVPSGQWCPTTPWQIITKLEQLIPKYFIY